MGALRAVVLGALAIVVGVPVAFLAVTAVGSLTGTTTTYPIPSGAMAPTLRCAGDTPGCDARLGDRVLVLRRFLSAGRGDMVAFRAPPAAARACGAGGTFLKRVVAVGGDTVEIRVEDGEGWLYVDGRRQAEPYVERSTRAPAFADGPLRVPAGRLYVLGDARNRSCDSREWGTLPEEAVVGRVALTYWPPWRLGIH